MNGYWAKKALCSTLAMSLLLMSSSVGWAETERSAKNKKSKKNAEGEVVETSEVVVTAARTEQLLAEVPVSVTLVDEQELRRNPQMDVASQLENVPGAQVHVMANGQRRINIRGMSGPRTLVIIDGVRQQELRTIDGAYINIDPDNIEKIEVIKGPASVLYGSEAIGGVINIVTKKGGKADKPVGFSTGFTASSATKSIEPRAAIFGDYNGFNYRFSGSGVNSHDRSVPGGKVWHSSYKQREYAGSLGYRWDGGSLNFTVDNFQGETETVPTRTVNSLAIPTDPWETATLRTISKTPKNDRTGYTGKLVLDDVTETLRKLTFSAYGQNSERQSDTIATLNHLTHPDGALTASQLNKHDSYGGAIQSEWLLGESHFVIFGLDYDKADFNAVEKAYNAGGNLTSRYVKDGYQETVALFAQDEWSFADDWALTMGLRQTWVETALTRMTNPPAGREGKIRDNNLVGSLGLVYSGVEDWHFRALYSQGYRNPNLLQKFMGSGTFMLPNPDLKPETSDNFEVGARFDNGNWNVDFVLFYSELKDGLSSDETSPGSGIYQYYNLDKVRNWGAELAVEYHIPDSNFTPYGSVTWLNYWTDNDGVKLKNNAKPYVWGKAGLKWENEINDHQTLFWDADMVMSAGARGKTVNALGEVVKTSNRHAWQTANLTIGLEGENNLFKYNTSLSLRNIFDQHYYQTSGTSIPEPGFNVVLSYGIEF